MNSDTPSTQSARPCIALIGMRGSGKSSVGRELARALAAECADTDELIVQEAGCTIAEIFEQEGESAFRRRESKTIACLVAKPSRVISVGGGAVMDNRNVEALKSIARIAWLAAPADILWERIRNDPATVSSRPVLAHDDHGTPLAGRDELVELLRQREPAYRTAAELIIDTADRTIEQVAAAIIDALDAAKT